MCVQTNTGWGHSERAQSLGECLFSAWQGLLLFPQLGAVPRAAVSRCQLCPVPVPLPSSHPFLDGHGVIGPAGLTLR